MILRTFAHLCFCGRVPWLYQYWPGGFMLFVVLCPGTPEGSTGSGSGFKASQKTGQRLKVSSDRLGEAGNRTCDPWFTRHRFIPYTTAASEHLHIYTFIHIHVPTLLTIHLYIFMYQHYLMLGKKLPIICVLFANGLFLHCYCQRFIYSPMY